MTLEILLFGYVVIALIARLLFWRWIWPAAKLGAGWATCWVVVVYTAPIAAIGFVWQLVAQ